MEGGKEAATRAAWIATGALIVVALVMYATMLLPDGTISWLLDEDHPLEGVGSIGLLLCSILSLLLWRRERRVGGPPWRTLSLLALAFLFFVAFGEEISWGQRILGFGTPDSLKELNDQGETNLHNLDTGAVNVLFQLFWLVYGVLIPLASLHERTRRFLVKLMPIMPVPFALGVHREPGDHQGRRQALHSASQPLRRDEVHVRVRAGRDQGVRRAAHLRRRLLADVPARPQTRISRRAGPRPGATPRPSPPSPPPRPRGAPPRPQSLRFSASMRRALSPFRSPSYACSSRWSPCSHTGSSRTSPTAAWTARSRAVSGRTRPSSSLPELGGEPHDLAGRLPRPGRGAELLGLVVRAVPGRVAACSSAGTGASRAAAAPCWASTCST